MNAAEQPGTARSTSGTARQASGAGGVPGNGPGASCGRTAPDPPAVTTAGPLLDLHRAGRLVGEYARVGALLADLPPDELRRAGRLLMRLDPDEVCQAHPALPAVRVAITGHGTLSELVPALTAELARHGLVPRTELSGYSSYVFDLSDPGSDLHRSGPDLVLCVLDPRTVLDEVPVPWRPEDVERVLDAKLELLEGLADRFAAASRGTLVLNTIPLPRSFAAQLVDLRSRAWLGAAWREANARLLRLAGSRPSTVVLDLDPLLSEGVPASDPRLSVYAKAHLSGGLLSAYAREAGHLAAHLAGRGRKALAVDLDGTLWGGVLGDDGVDGIEIAEGYRGEAFSAFQRTVKQLASQGVLLAAVSKNDAEAVREALREHPGMTLREDDFVRIAAGWGPKHLSLEELAADLGLGTDAFVLVDDSPYECGLVRRELPGVAVVPVGSEPALHGERLLRDGWFTVRELTGEDRARTELYRGEAERRDFLRGFEEVGDYLRELDIHVTLAAVSAADVARVAQLTLRTNQFNLTTRRLQAPEVAAVVGDPSALALAVRSDDRFGDNGLVGAVFLRRDGDRLLIDNLLLSCRVFSRGIEQACLAAVLRHARETGAAEVVGTYRPSPKNGKVRGFYPGEGFTPVPSDDPSALVFRHTLDSVPEPPGHIGLTVRLDGTTTRGREAGPGAGPRTAPESATEGKFL